MDITNIKNKRKKSKTRVNINIKVSIEAANWIKEKDYSPTGIFKEALKDLGYEEEDNE